MCESEVCPSLVPLPMLSPDVVVVDIVLRLAARASIRVPCWPNTDAVFSMAFLDSLAVTLVCPQRYDGR